MSVYKMAGFPDRLLVQLPNSKEQKYEWFGIDEYGVNLLHGVGTFPYRHHRHDIPFGILLEDPKLQDDWIIKWDGTNVQFSNDDFDISVTKNLKNGPIN